MNDSMLEGFGCACRHPMWHEMYGLAAINLKCNLSHMVTGSRAARWNTSMASPQATLRRCQKLALHALLAVTLVVVAVVAPRPQEAAAMAPTTFINWIAPMAQQGEREQGVPASVSIAQAILESGWGESKLTKEANSFFGIKCFARVSPYQNGCYEIATQEYNSDGSAYTIVAKFRKYDTPEKSVIDHGYFLRTNSRYNNAFNYRNYADRFAFEIHKAGYATDPQYANMLIGIMSTYNLYRFDLASPSTAAPSVVVNAPSSAAGGADVKVTGLAGPGQPKRAVWTEVLVNGEWRKDVTSTTSATRGIFTIPLSYGKNTAGTYTFRVRVAATNGATLTSAQFTLRRTSSVTPPSTPTPTPAPTTAPTATPKPTPTTTPKPTPTTTPTATPKPTPTTTPTATPKPTPTTTPKPTPSTAPTTAPKPSPTAAPTTPPTSKPTVTPTSAPPPAPRPTAPAPATQPTTAPAQTEALPAKLPVMTVETSTALTSRLEFSVPAEVSAAIRTRYSIRGRIEGLPQGTVVTAEILLSGTWLPASTGKTTANGAYAVPLNYAGQVRGPKTYRLRVSAPSGAEIYSAQFTMKRY